ncbi:hypothetical protein AAFF_G00270210 [Aldrovandia affinis]|uniref:RING-type domain-containing protein n=1 Tax=Aldrovandia affinis TaxID=143900 RepID=A0AAD7W2F7_9TELE|nr:hypothetical protein AAFF_G00270210 [Aldrovandia affinis]
MEDMSHKRPVIDMGLGLSFGDSMESVMESVSLSVLEDDPRCGACGEVFAEPLVLSCVLCGRSFCGACLQRHWERSASRECPLCDGWPPGGAPPQAACAEHGHRLTLFCLEELRPVCAACRESASHSGHRVYPLTEATLDCKVRFADCSRSSCSARLCGGGGPRCGACGEVFGAPLVLSCVLCGRSFCGACLQRHWERSASRECPLCDRGPPGGAPPQAACAEHGHRLTLFCLEELRPVCAACRESASHSGHRVYPLTEAALDCKVGAGPFGFRLRPVTLGAQITDAVEIGGVVRVHCALF